MISTDFFDCVQKASLPGVWSKGISLSRSDAVLKDSQQEDEIILRVRAPDNPVSRKVTLWPQDEDWFCDCGSKTKVCAHVAAAVISLKSGKADPARADAGPPKSGQIIYRFTRQDKSLLFERKIAFVLTGKR